MEVAEVRVEGSSSVGSHGTVASGSLLFHCEPTFLGALRTALWRIISRLDILTGGAALFEVEAREPPLVEAYLSAEVLPAAFFAALVLVLLLPVFFVDEEDEAAAPGSLLTLGGILDMHHQGRELDA